MTGLTSNPTIFEQAIKNSSAYDAAIRQELAQGKSGEELFFELAIEDLTRAADLFRPIHDRTSGVDGWVSLEVSPLLAYDTAATIAAAKSLLARAARHNLMIKIPGTNEGLPAIEEAIFAGMPINVTLLFSREQYFAAAEAYLRGIERRIEAGLEARRRSVASVFISRWDSAVAEGARRAAPIQLGIAIGQRMLQGVLRAASHSPRWQRVYNAGARPQRLLLASTGTKDPKASDVLYIKALAAPLDGQHDSRGDVEGARGPRRARGAAAAPTAATAKTVLRAVREAGVDRRRARDPTAGRRRESRSSSRGTS